MAGSRSPEVFVESFAKGLSVLLSFDEGHRSMTLSEAAERTGLTRAAARRFLLTLVELGYAEQERTHFRLTPRVLLLGQAFLRSSSIADLSRPILERLTTELEESVSVAVLDELDVLFIALNQSRRLMSPVVSIGARLPAVATSLGRAILAFDPRGPDIVAKAPLVRFTARTITSRTKLRAAVATVREEGFAVGDEEYEEGFRSLSVPVRDRTGRVVAAMNVSGSVHRSSVAEMKRRFLPPLRDAARELGELIG